MCGRGTAYPFGEPEFTHDFKWDSYWLIISFLCPFFCKQLCVLFYFFVWTLCCLSFFDLLLRYLQTFLVRDHSMTIHIFFGSIKNQLVSEKKMLVFLLLHFPFSIWSYVTVLSYVCGHLGFSVDEKIILKSVV